MSKNQEGSFLNVLSVNSYNHRYVVSDLKTLDLTTSPEYKKEQYAISYLNTKDSITTHISISRNISDEDIEDAIISKVYDELALDQAIEYQIRYIEVFENVGDEREFNLFIVDPLTISETFASTISRINYLDCIIPAPLLIKSIYTKELLDDGTHCFIYFEEDDAFIAVYKDKEFIYTKSLNFSLSAMHERFCELYGERLEYKEFVKFISTQSLKETDSDYKDYMFKLYKEIFSTINDVILYIKRAFDLEQIDTIYIGAQIFFATKLHEMAEFELNIESKDFDFNYGFNTNQVYINQLHSLMQVYALMPEDEKYDINFTTFHRPPKFIKRESGKMILLTVASIVIAFSYPVFYWSLSYAENLHHSLLKNEYSELHREKDARKKIIDAKKAQRLVEIAKLKKEETSYLKKKNTLVKIHKVKVDYPMKAKLMTMFTNDFNIHQVRLNSITYLEESDKKKFIFNLLSSSDKKITKLVEYLTKKYNLKYNFIVENIIYDEKTKEYTSSLEVSL